MSRYYYTEWNTDSSGNKKLEHIQNESHKIVNNKFFLDQVPDGWYKVKINNMFEVTNVANVANETQFKVNYDNGEITFHSNLEGSDITVTEYYGVGLIKISSKRIVFENDGSTIVATDIDGAIKEQNSRIDNIVSNSGVSNQEIVDGRYSSAKNITYATLKNRLDANETDTENISDEIVTARKGEVDLVTKINTIDSEIETNSSKLSDICNDSTFQNNSFLSHISSYVGLINTGYVADDATRFYILPKNYVATGTGGAIKIFGDPYHLDQTKYRDLGIYFHANQNGDIGYNGKGCFFINGKVAGADYADKHPDIVFSFQDGAQVAGRIVRLNNGLGTYACMILGSGTIEMAHLDGAIRAEVHGKLGMRNSQYIVWLNAVGTSLDGIIGYTSGDIMQMKGKNGNEFYVNSVKKFETTLNTSKFYNAVVHNPKYVLSDSAVTTPDVTGYNRIQLGQSSPVTITNFLNGQDGQQLRILFSNSNTTLQHGTNIRLAGGVNFVGSQYATITLELFGTTWYEMSRSINHS